jgi:hypothetical protein
MPTFAPVFLPLYVEIMPMLSMFYGLSIEMYYAPGEHNPPHIHIKYQDDFAIMDITTGKITAGHLSVRHRRLVQAWVEIHREELMANWECCQNGIKPLKINPLM